jgi:hypothetical protein
MSTEPFPRNYFSVRAASVMMTVFGGHSATTREAEETAWKAALSDVRKLRTGELTISALREHCVPSGPRDPEDDTEAALIAAWLDYIVGVEAYARETES